MNLSNRWLTGITLSLLLTGAIASLSGQPSPSQNAEPSAIQKAVLSRLTEIQKAAEALNPDKVFSFVLENDAGALAQNGKLFLSRGEALESTKRGFQRLQKVEYHFDQQHVSVLCPTVAVAAGEGLSTISTDDGRTISTRFAQTVVLVLTNGEWKVFHAHRSFPPAR
jgi:hypothetical protein